jgi:hypothetical protein
VEGEFSELREWGVLGTSDAGKGALCPNRRASGEGRDSNPRRRITGVTAFKKAAALVHSATSPIVRILYSPNVGEEAFSEVRMQAPA